MSWFRSSCCAWIVAQVANESRQYPANRVFQADLHTARQWNFMDVSGAPRGRKCVRLFLLVLLTSNDLKGRGRCESFGCGRTASVLY